MAYIEMKHSYKRYQVGESEIVANNDINFAIEKGCEKIVVIFDKLSLHTEEQN